LRAQPPQRAFAAVAARRLYAFSLPPFRRRDILLKSLKSLFLDFCRMKNHIV
jgi:hypothetical protein